ncbi:MAG: hypothetical protein ACRDLM_03195 [Gaiellaceae bacterium]
MSASGRFDEIRAQRFAFLRAVYDETDGTTDRMVQMNEIGAKLSFDEELTDKVVSYLIGENLLEWAAMGGLIELTHWGLKEVEEVLSTPQQPTEHFLPLVVAENVLQIGSMTNSQIQQGTSGSVQTLAPLDVESLRGLTNDLRALITELDLEREEEEEFYAELVTIDAQLASPRPKPAIIRESLGSARRIIEAAIGGGLATASPQVAHALEQLAGTLTALPH